MIKSYNSGSICNGYKRRGCSLLVLQNLLASNTNQVNNYNDFLKIWNNLIQYL